MKKIIIGVVAVAAIILLIGKTTETKKVQDKPVEVIRNEAQEQVSYEITTDLEAGTYVVAPEKTVLNWEGGSILKSHYGTIDVNVTDIAVAEDQSVTGDISLLMDSLISEVGASLDGHLKNEDFFDVAKYPTATFVIDSYTDGILLGNLTIKGVTKAFSAPALVTASEGELVLSSDFSFDRTEFGVTYNSGKFFDDLGDKVISDDIDISLTLVAQK